VSNRHSVPVDISRVGDKIISSRAKYIFSSQHAGIPAHGQRTNAIDSEHLSWANKT
jgi:hypothetical protein